MITEGNTGSVLGVDAGMAARALGGALLIAVIAAIIVALVSLLMFLREPIYRPTARVWVERDLRIGPPAPGPDSRLTETTPAMVRLAASRPVAEETRRSVGLPADSAELLENLNIERVRDTTFMDLTYRGTDRKKATQTVNTFARVASERLSVAPSKNLTAVVWEEAQVPPAVPDPKPLRNGLLTLVGVWALYAGGHPYHASRVETCGRTSENSVKRKFNFRESPFHVLGCMAFSLLCFCIIDTIGN